MNSRTFTVVGPSYIDYSGTYGEPPWDPPEFVQPWFEVNAESAAKAKASLLGEEFVEMHQIPGQSPFKLMAAIRRPDCYEEHGREAERRIEALGDTYTEEEFYAAQEGICGRCDRYQARIEAAIDRLNARYSA